MKQIEKLTGKMKEQKRPVRNRKGKKKSGKKEEFIETQDATSNKKKTRIPKIDGPIVSESDIEEK